MRILVENICSFFVNGVDTRTQGVDVVASAKDFGLTGFNVSVAGNYNTVKREGGVRTPDPIAAAGGTIFNRAEESYLLTSRPKYKGTLALEYSFDRWTVNLNNTLYGPATFANIDLPDASKPVDDPKSSSYARLVFDSKVLTDIILNYRLTETVGLNLAVNNVLNVVPHYRLENLPAGKSEKDARNDVDFNGRYNTTSYDGSHFSINGTTFLASLSVTF